ncbi:MAG: hypothetical protein ABI231_01215 [Candidatus Tumulicola sp.]
MPSRPDADAAYAAQSRALDEEILGVITGWHDRGAAFEEEAFNDLALRLLEYQLRYDRPYARYCASFGIASSALPRWWQDIPPVPAAAFKDAALATFDSSNAALAFETSGTTAGRPGRHFFETPALYDAALLAAFDRFMLPDGARLRYLNLVPDPTHHSGSSLGYMMQQVGRARGARETGWYLRGEGIAFDAFVADLRAAIADEAPVCVAATAFALVRVLDLLDRERLRLGLPNGSRVMETGGFKGRARTLERDDLYRRIARSFGIRQDAIVAEYGMTELTTQYYDDVLIRHPSSGSAAVRRKLAPPWLRTRVVGPDGKTLPSGTVGALVHIDLANRSSCLAIATEDLGAQFDPSNDPDEPAGLVLIGRERGAALRGCSLDAESLH